MLGRDNTLNVVATAAEDGLESLRLEREASVLARVAHPSLVTVIDLGREGEVTFMAPEALKGRRLSECIHAGLGLERALSLTAQVLDGLANLHQNGFIHRDVNPRTVLIPHAGRAKLFDFGVARIAVSETTGPAAIGSASRNS